MDKRSIPIAIVSCILALAGVAGYLMPSPTTEAEPARLLMENPGGRVIFTHKAHSTPGGAYGDNACLVCHHELKIAPAAQAPDGQPEVMLCTACHGTADDPAFVESHQKLYAAGGDLACVSCHHARLEGLSDKWNHEEHIDYASDDCQTCHHEESYTLESGRVMNIKPQKCSNCHTSRPNPMSATILKDAVHTKCQPCHEDLFEGASGCGTCHNVQRTADLVAQGSFDKQYGACSACHPPMSGSMDAFHSNCMGCHDKAGKGPGKAAPCAQCHTP